MKLRKLISTLLAVAMALSLLMVPVAATGDDGTDDHYGHVRGYPGNLTITVDETSVLPQNYYQFYITLPVSGSDTRYYFPTFSDAIKATTSGFYWEMIYNGSTVTSYFCDCPADADGKTHYSSEATRSAFLNREPEVVVYSENHNNSVTISDNITIEEEVHFVLCRHSNNVTITAETQSINFTGQITVKSGGSLIQDTGRASTSATVTLTNPIKVESGGTLSLRQTGGVDAHPTVWKLAEGFSGEAAIIVEEGGSLELTDVNIGSTGDTTPAILSAGEVTIKPRLRSDTAITSIVVQDGGQLSLPDTNSENSNVTTAIASIEIKDGGDAELGLGTIQSLSLAEGAEATIDAAEITTVSLNSGSSVTLGENFSDSSTAFDLPSGASLTSGGTTVTVGDGENKVASNGIVTLAAGASSDDTQNMNAAVLLSDGTLIEGSESEAPAVSTDDTTGTTTVTVPNGGAVTGSDGNRVVYTNGGSVDQAADGDTTVTGNPVSVTGITLDRSSLTLYSNTTPNTATLTATVIPSDASNKTVTWSSSNESVATVANGVVTAVAPGEATITATAGDKTAACTVTVVPATTPIVPGDTVRYIVEHWLEGRWGYEVAEREYPAGKIDETVTAQPKNYPGYRYNASISTASDTLTEINGEDDIVVLKLYYDKRTTSRPSGGGSEPSYTVSVEDADHGEITVSPKRAQEGDEVTVTATPDEGYELDTLTVTDKDGDELRLTENRDGTFSFEMPASRVTIEATFVPVEEEPVVTTPVNWTNPFTDVATGAWYYDAVGYVYANGIMTGVTPTAFSPDTTTTRAQIWTILARLNGQNVEGGSPWYAAAQQWAISAGVSDGTAPDAPITREQLAAMLYRAAGSPAVSGNLLAYPDGNAVSPWAESAMLWATQNGIITGIDGALTPQGSATRAQVAAMLTRAQ